MNDKMYLFADIRPSSALSLKAFFGHLGSYQVKTIKALRLRNW